MKGNGGLHQSRERGEGQQEEPGRNTNEIEARDQPVANLVEAEGWSERQPECDPGERRDGRSLRGARISIADERQAAEGGEAQENEPGKELGVRRFKKRPERVDSRCEGGLGAGG